MSKDYNLIKNDNYEEELIKVDKKIEVKEIDFICDYKEDKSFSKKNMHLITKEEQSKLDYGIRIHEILELTDFVNPNYDGMSLREREVVGNFINKIDINNCNIYKEYEFVYEEDNIMYHGIIDLILEYSDNIRIIDYKLKNIDDKEYLKQLNGYKNYIEKLFDKKVEVYLYSILLNKLDKIDV